jgi:UDP-glucose 4-epimerase
VKVLITGISGAHARLLTHQLLKRGHEVIGIDRRPWPKAPKTVPIFQADVRKRPATDVFRKHRPDAVVHMATVSHLHASREERFRINLQGTRAVFEHCHDYGVKQAIFVGRHTIYGAAPDAPIYRTEDEPPLAVSTFPEMADQVAADLYAGQALWRYPELKTCVLRMVYLLGATRRGTLASFLSAKRVPMVMGFDPLFHFMHDRDGAHSIVAAIEAELCGVFNIAGPPPVPLSILCKVTGSNGVPVPEALLPRMLGRLGFSNLPVGAIPHLKHPVVVDASRFCEATGWTPIHDEHATMASFRAEGERLEQEASYRARD